MIAKIASFQPGLMLAAVLFWGIIGLGACAPAAPASSTPLALRPTWTPTPTAVSRPTITPAPASVAAPARRATSSPTATPALTPVGATPTPGRIDAAGPEPIATIAPLPPGQGASPVRILIPALGLDAPVQAMGWHVVGDHTEWDVPLTAAGRHIDSAYPGEKGNVVISGHHNIGSRVFAQVSRIGEPGAHLGLGDAIILEDEIGRRFVYRITGWRRIREAGATIAARKENASYLLPTDFPQLTLITCWPATSNTHRVIIFAALTQIIAP